jgi:hypothetical protein
MTIDTIREYIIKWNVDFPIDHWWRKKYKVAFNSIDHREACFLDQLIEYEEDKLFNTLSNEEKYKPGTGNWLKTKVPETIEESISQLRDEFKDID